MRRILRVGTRTLSPLMRPLRSFVASRKRTSDVVQQLLDRFAPLQEAVGALFRSDPQKRYARWIAAFDTIDDADLSAMREEQSRFADPPLLSIIVLKTTASEALTDSLHAQVYRRWDVNFPETLAAGVAAAESEFVVLLDPSVSLRPHALFMLACTIDRCPDAALIYADEDALDATGARSDHYFKPDWNEELLRGQNYFGGFVGFRRSLALDVRGCEVDADDAWGLFLQMTARTPPDTIHHLPFILSHRRRSEASDPKRREQAARALEHRLARIGEDVRVEPVGEKSYRTRYVSPANGPLVSIVVPSTCELDILGPCLGSVLNNTSYHEFELLLTVNGVRTMNHEQRQYLDTIEAQPQVRVLPYEELPFNFSKVNNWAAEQARGELVCFLNDDTEVIGADWLSAMVAHVGRDRVAAVGAMLFYPNERIQHAGVLLGAGGVAAHIYSRRRRDIRGYHDRALIDQDVSGVTAACMLVRRNVFIDVGGFDESLAIAFNDVDFCLRLREPGWRIVWTPSAKLYHKESASIGRHYADERQDEWHREFELMQSRWRKELLSDPHYSPNLSLDALELWEPAFPPRVSYPWRSPAREHASSGQRDLKTPS